MPTSAPRIKSASLISALEQLTHRVQARDDRLTGAHGHYEEYWRDEETGKMVLKARGK